MLFAAAAQARSAQSPGPALYVARLSSPLARLTTVVLSMAGSPASTAPARIALELPKGYSMQFARPAGSPIGFGAVVQGNLALPNGDVSVIYGTILIADAAKVAADPAAQACDPDAHIGVWDLDLTQKNAPDIHVPIFVDAGDMPDAAYRLELCPPASLSASAAFALSFPSPIVAEPTTSGSYVWRALVTPALADGTGPDPAQTFEVRAVVPVPQSLNLHARYDARTHTATVSGVATELGRPKAGVKIYIDADSAHAHAHLDPVTTDSGGRYSARWAIAEQTDFTASVEATEAGPCPAPPIAPGGCLSQSVSEPPDEEVTLKVPLLTDAKRLLKAADQAAAARVNLAPADFPAGWTSRPLEPGAFAACGNVHPDESRLTVTGSSYSPIFVSGDFVTTSFQAAAAVVRVWRTPAQARAAFNREASKALLQCIADDPGDGFSLVGFGTIPVGEPGRIARGFRVVVRDDNEGTTYYLDVIVLLGKRSLVTLTVESSGAAPSVEAALVVRLAARAARV
ncbi:MAG: hypothetical protein ACJ77B_06035 [Chloroflexota bacterium]